MTPNLSLNDPAFVGAAGAAGGGFSDDSQLRAYWKFSEVSGDIINASQSSESLGSAADLQVTGATYNQDITPFSYSMFFDGINDFAKAGTDAEQFNFFSDGSQSSINIWVRWTLASNDKLFDNHHATDDATIGYDIRVKSGSTNEIFYMISNDSGFPVVAGTTTGGYVPDNTNTYMLTMTWDHDLGIDNLLMYRDATVNQYFNKTAQPPNTGDPDTALFMGCTDGTSYFFESYCAECSMWSRVLTPTEITELYNSGDGLAIY